MAHSVRIRLVQNSDIVTGREKAVDQFRIEAGLQPQTGMGRTPGTAEQPARRIERLLKWLPKNNVTSESPRLALRLAVAAHSAVSDDAAVLERGQRRIERMKGPAAGRQRVERLGVEGKASTAV